MGKRTIIIIVSAVAVVVASVFVYKKVRKILTYADIKAGTANPNEIPAMTIKSFKLEETDGPNSRWTLTAQKADMFKNSGRILFDKVETLVNADALGKTNYKITSDKGTYFINSDKVVLDTNVVVQTSQGYKVLTDSIEYFAKTKRIKSSSPVTIQGKSPSGQMLDINGEGISGDLGTGDFKITKKINTKFGPKLEISSGTSEFNTNKNMVVFEKDLLAKKDGLDITGDKLIARYSEKGELGDIEVMGDVRIKAEKRYALCNHALIKAGSSEVVLTGKPEFHSGRDVIVGKKIVFFADSDEVYVEKVKAEVTEDSMRKKK